MAWTKGLNFRAISTVVTDGADETYVQADPYPTVRNVSTFGWLSNTSTIQVRDRSTTVDRRLVGLHFTEASTGASFQIDLPSSGDYLIRAAYGDGANPQTINISLLDDGVVFSSVTGDAGANQFFDAAGVLRTAAEWPSSNTSLSRTFSTTSLILRINSTAVASYGVAHLFLDQVIQGGGAPQRVWRDVVRRP